MAVSLAFITSLFLGLPVGWRPGEWSCRLHLLFLKDLSYPASPVHVLLPGHRLAGGASQSFWDQLWRAIAPPPWLGQAGRVTTSRAPHAEHRIRLPSSGTGNSGPRLSINNGVATSALWLHRLHQQKTPIFSAARSARVVGFLGSLRSTSRFLKPPMPPPLPIFNHFVHELF